MPSKIRFDDFYSKGQKIFSTSGDVLSFTSGFKPQFLDANPEIGSFSADGEIYFDQQKSLLKYSNNGNWKILNQYDVASPFPLDVPLNGLVQFLDVSQPASYPGSGNTWFDLTPNNHDIDLGSDVSFVNQFGGVLNFAETPNGYGRNNTMNLSSSDNSVVTWVRKNSNGNNGRTVTALNNNWLLGHHDTSYGDYYAEGWVNNIASPQSDTVWRMFTGTGNIANDVWQLYINDQLITSNSAGSQGPNGWNLNSQYSQYSDCQIANIIVYNRVLSAQEVAQIYQAYRTKFGV